MTQYRQGDIFFEQVTEDEAATVEASETVERDSQGRLIIAHGEATGHAHAIKSKRAQLRRAVSGVMILRAAAQLKVWHEEHSPITLPRGWYQITRQREYAPEAIRQVAD